MDIDRDELYPCDSCQGYGHQGPDGPCTDCGGKGVTPFHNTWFYPVLVDLLSE